MKALFAVGLVVLILGIVSFFVPFPHTENHGIKAGDMSIGVQTHDSQHISPVLSGVLVAIGGVMMIAGGRSRS